MVIHAEYLVFPHGDPNEPPLPGTTCHDIRVRSEKKGGPFELRPRFEDDMRGLSRTARAKEVLKKKKGAARECRSAIRREMHLRRQVSRRGWWSRSSMEDVGGGTL